LTIETHGLNTPSKDAWGLMALRVNRMRRLVEFFG